MKAWQRTFSANFCLQEFSLPILRGVHPDLDLTQLTRPDQNRPTPDRPESSSRLQNQKPTPVGRMAGSLL